MPKRVTKEEWQEIRQDIYGELEPEERDELEKFWRADLSESGIEEGISQTEFSAGMAWLRSNMSKHKFEANDLAEIEKAFNKHLKD